MKTVLLGPPKPEIEALIARRRALGQDRHDEVWEGEYHMAPDPHVWHALVEDEITRALGPRADVAGLRGSGSFNLGVDGDFRIPDGGYHRGTPNALWLSTAAIVVEILSPDDESFEKFGFYFRHGVEEILVVDPKKRVVRWFVRGDGEFAEATGSSQLAVSSVEVHRLIRWPA